MLKGGAPIRVKLRVLSEKLMGVVSLLLRGVADHFNSFCSHAGFDTVSYLLSGDSAGRITEQAMLALAPLLVTVLTVPT